MNKTVTALVVVGLAVLSIVGWFVFVNNDESDTQTTTSEQLPINDQTNANTTPTQPPAVEEPESEVNQISLAEVAVHNTKEDCWTAINGNVYDLTEYIPRHKGRDNIVSACGVDATSYFAGEQSGQLGGTKDHTSSQSALRDLERLKIGVLAN